MKRVSLIEFSRIITDKSTALKFLCKQCKTNDAVCFPSCNSEKYYITARGKMRCKHCKTDYKPFRGTWLDIINIDFVKWLALIKLFDLGISARRAAVKSNVSYPTALNAFDCIRYAILYHLAEADHQLKGEIEADEAYFGGRRKGNRTWCQKQDHSFWILERNGKVSVSIVSDVSAKTLLNQTVKKVRRGSIVYTDKWRGYDSLMFSGYKHMAIDHQKRFANGKVYINGIEGFWSFAKERMAKASRCKSWQVLALHQGDGMEIQPSR